MTKQKEFIQKLLGVKTDYLLTALSSEYSEGEEEMFEENYGIDFKTARKYIDEFVKKLIK